ncbi:hypothetical protein AMTR_s00029p00241590 [Amborella trichopoda]|uniref:Ribosomal protein n=1 Tax=Amborella trichopoda TaxID=13333 RepID=W1PPQ7_AMBTC|nr:hypothetical protein AMTR_s00029p00241590 [Amborella trichopoda]
MAGLRESHLRKMEFSCHDVVLSTAAFEKSMIIRRRGIVRVLCTANPKHKQRQGMSTFAYEGPLPPLISESASSQQNLSSNEGSKEY